eukprot:SAG31_NODE_25138_length_467_cov_0.880435_2_plen_67_part_01
MKFESVYAYLIALRYRPPVCAAPCLGDDASGALMAAIGMDCVAALHAIAHASQEASTACDFDLSPWL